MQELLEKIQEPTFPCIMAKAVMNQGRCEHLRLAAGNEFQLAKEMFAKLSDFVDLYRADKDRLHSCIISFEHARFQDFATFETTFWKLLQGLRCLDDKQHSYDPRVSSNPEDGNFSFSVKSEAFFILLLHPNSPRKARQFALPSIVFNPHQQFEDLRTKGTFHKVRSMIRARDERYQGSVNPMLMDFGSDVSEIFQYSGLNYTAEAQCPYRRDEGVA